MVKKETANEKTVTVTTVLDKNLLEKKADIFVNKPVQASIGVKTPAHKSKSIALSPIKEETEYVEEPEVELKDYQEQMFYGTLMTTDRAP